MRLRLLARTGAICFVLAGGLLSGGCSHERRSEAIAFTPKRVATARENLRRYAWARSVFDSLRALAEDAARRSPEELRRWIPEITPTRAVNCPVCWANWRGYIWQWSPEDPDALRCARCGGRVVPDSFPRNDSLVVRDPQGKVHVLPVYRDSSGRRYFLWERLGYQHLQHVGRWLEALAAVYAVRPEPELARAAKTLLLRLAEVYPGYALHDWSNYGTEPWPRAGKISGWNYEDAVFLVQCGKAFDATSSSSVWTPAERDSVKQGLFRCGADFLTAVRPDQGIVNDISFRFAGVAWAGRILKDHKVMRWVLDDELGVVPFIRSRWFPDGTWSERSPSYDLMALRSFHEAVEALEGYSDPPLYQGPDRFENVRLQDVRRLREIYEHPFRLTYPDGTLPPINDSHAGQRPPALLAEAGLAWYGADVFLKNLAVALGDTDLARGSAYALFHRPPDAPERLRRLLAVDSARVRPSFRSDYLGLVALRGHAFGEEAMLTIQYGGVHGGHDHHDKLDLTLFACGREMLSDLGYVYWAHPDRFLWTRRSLAHSTVTVDGINQALSGGSCVLFAPGDWVQAVEAEAPNVYSLVTPVFNRQVVWVQSGERGYAVDIFRVRGGRMRDWSAHAETADLRLKGATLYPVAEVPGCDYAYHQLKAVRSGRIRGPLQVDWVWREKPRARLRLYLLSPTKGQVYVGEGPAQRHQGEQGRTLPFVIVRDQDQEATTFVAVWEPSRGTSAPLEVQLVRCEPGAEGWPVEVAVRVDERTEDRVCTALRDNPGLQSTAGFGWSGRIGVVRLDRGKVVKAFWRNAFSNL